MADNKTGSGRRPANDLGGGSVDLPSHFPAQADPEKEGRKMPKAKRRREFASIDVEKEFPELARHLARERAFAPPGFDQPASRHYEWIAATSLALADGFFSPDRSSEMPAVLEEVDLLSKRAFALAKQVEVYLPEVYAQVVRVGSGLCFGMPHKNPDAAVAEWRMIAQAASARLAADAASMEGLLLLLRAKTAAAPPGTAAQGGDDAEPHSDKLDYNTTLETFMGNFCAPLRPELVKRCAKQLRDAHKNKTCLLPPYVGKPKRGQRHAHNSAELMKAWPRLRDHIPELPPLKQFTSKTISTVK